MFQSWLVWIIWVESAGWEGVNIHGGYKLVTSEWNVFPYVKCESRL